MPKLKQYLTLTTIAEEYPDYILVVEAKDAQEATEKARKQATKDYGKPFIGEYQPSVFERNNKQIIEFLSI